MIHIVEKAVSATTTSVDATRACLVIECAARLCLTPRALFDQRDECLHCCISVVVTLLVVRPSAEAKIINAAIDVLLAILKRCMSLHVSAHRCRDHLPSRDIASLTCQALMEDPEWALGGYVTFWVQVAGYVDETVLQCLTEVLHSLIRLGSTEALICVADIVRPGAPVLAEVCMQHVQCGLSDGSSGALQLLSALLENVVGSDHTALAAEGILLSVTAAENVTLGSLQAQMGAIAMEGNTPRGVTHRTKNIAEQNAAIVCSLFNLFAKAVALLCAQASCEGLLRALWRSQPSFNKTAYMGSVLSFACDILEQSRVYGDTCLRAMECIAIFVGVMAESSVLDTSYIVHRIRPGVCLRKCNSPGCARACGKMLGIIAQGCGESILYAVMHAVDDGNVYLRVLLGVLETLTAPGSSLQYILTWCVHSAQLAAVTSH